VDPEAVADPEVRQFRAELPFVHADGEELQLLSGGRRDRKEPLQPLSVRPVETDRDELAGAEIEL
jgi:hypothetical protein